MRVPKRLSGVLVTLAVASPVAAGQWPGDLDTTFGVGGKLVHPGFARVEDVVALPDGKILLVGSRVDAANDALDIQLARYRPDGTLDDGFGTGGVVVTDFDGVDDRAEAALIQPDGKIVVVGQHGYDVFCCERYYDLILVRYEPDGSLDAAFGDGGKVITDFGWGHDIGTDVALQADGKIVVAGSQAVGNADFVVARYNSDGSPDAGFGLGGSTTTVFPAPYSNAAAASVMIQAGGGILLGGTASRLVLGVHRSDYALARYRPDGFLDTGFAEEGLAITDLGTDDDIASAAALQPDGRIVQVGQTDAAWDPNLHLFAAVRYLADGGLDPSFGAGGVARSDLGYLAGTGDVAIQADGRILVAGRGGAGADFTLLRYTPEGRPDRSFGFPDGKVFTDFQQRGQWDNATGAAIQADGKVVVAGDHFGLGHNGLIARYHGVGDVRPDVKVNGADFGVVVSGGEAIEVTIGLDPGPRVGEQAAWWLVAKGPSGLRTYDFETGAWIFGAAPSYVGPLVRVTDRTVFAGPAPPAGPFTLDFGVRVLGGSPPELPYFDEIRVMVAP